MLSIFIVEFQFVFNKHMWQKLRIILPLLSALLLGCNQGNISVTNPKWECGGSRYKQTCNIVFFAINKKNEPAKATIHVRAYYFQNKGKGAKSNVILGGKRIKVFLSPNEKKLFSETIVVYRTVSTITATIY